MKMKRILTITALAAAAVLMAAGCGQRGAKAAREAGTENETAEALAEAPAGPSSVWDSLPAEPVFDIVTTMGTIRVKLYSKTPKHRENFIKLVKSHYYDGVLFHRVINHFMIQAGDPLTKDPARSADWGTGGPNYTIPAEFVPEYYHKKGALAAARRGDAANPRKASHGSQFYLVQDEYACLELDGEYTVFGETIEGLDVIDRIASVQTDRQDRPLKNVKILRIILSEDQSGVPSVECESSGAGVSAAAPDTTKAPAAASDTTATGHTPHDFSADTATAGKGLAPLPSEETTTSTDTGTETEKPEPPADTAAGTEPEE